MELAAGGTAGNGGASGGLGPNLAPSGYPRCGPLDPERADDCAGIEHIIPMDPDASASVDGSIRVGESWPVSVWVKNGDALDHDDVCVGVTVDTPGVTVAAEGADSNPLKVGQMYPGGVFIVTPAFFHVGDVEPGTVARFTTWATYEGTNCLGPTATVDALVQAYPY